MVDLPEPAPGTPITDEAIRIVLKAVEDADGNKKDAATALGISNPRLHRHLRAGEKRGITLTRTVEFPEIPDDDIPTEQIIDIQRVRNRRRREHRKALEWFPVKINMDGPIAVSFFGDPHVDDDGCDWDTLYHHCELHRKTEGLFGVNIGDTTNNWVDRLMRLYAHQETSKKTATKLAKWFLQDSGIDWIVWLFGNHDAWNDGDALLSEMNISGVPMVDWQARFKIVMPNGKAAKIWAAHNFAGHSMWNTLHGPQKAAHMKGEADIYVCGHTHNWALHQEESASRDFVYWLARARGYKFLDTHADRLGHFSQNEGAAITAVIDPEADTPSRFIHCYADMDEAVEILKAKRARWKKKK